MATTTTINCSYLSSVVTCTSSSSTQDSSSSSPILPTKIILPNKKPQKWSTGVAPGDYGGPPTTTKLRKYWGGEKEDPITSDELIWNRDFMPHMKRLIGDDEEQSGFLSINRVMSLDSMEVDLSKELKATLNPIVDKQPKAAQATKVTSVKWRPAPTRREQDKWDRAAKAATGGSEVMFRDLRKPKGDPKVLAAKSREQYFKLKKKLQTLTLAIGGVGLVSAYVSYTPEIAASYGVGLIGSLVYMRMLGNSMDGMADGARGVIKGAIGQPRLLVPVALVMIYNRWNGIVVPEYGLMHLELIPMLVGFFTYKIATFTQAIEDAINVVSDDVQTDEEYSRQ
uniref:protein CONSERVED ONLY IN THE GREEN LINEAGE 160, chloroplastic isoform X2 n=1 Tax=Erigeron canadensis TaxID=72917 RepID=UPI001CB95D5A|nr:protein CONSERVED ONLY IN THE GREEN LINEAGE 160, chloroplastic isoform X2 [Erigeron canadensis]